MFRPQEGPGPWGRWSASLLMAAVVVSSPCSGSWAATLPAHRPLRVLIVGDEVNPHRLPPEELTQPADVLAALSDSSSGLEIGPRPDDIVLVPGAR